MRKRTSLLGNTAIWLGASISVAEIMSGAYIASLGIQKGLTAILIGHIIGALLFYLCGRIGAESGRSAMDCAALSFGVQGAGIFACMNVMQLVMWSAIMLRVSARALTIITAGLIPTWGGSLLIGAAVAVWIFLGGAEIGRVNLITSAMLLVLTFFICSNFVISGNELSSSPVFQEISFGSAIELSLAVPLSWLPLVADYTSKAERPHFSNIVSTVVYTIGSTWMYSIGLMAALYSNNSDIVNLLVRTSIIRVSMLIVVLAAMTTTFLDACSAGISAQTVSKKYSIRLLALIAISIATLLSIVRPVENYDAFLYVIASVFVPMGSIMITDYFFLGKRETDKALDLGTMLLWAVGFVIYHLLMGSSSVVGCTIPLIILLSVIRFLTERSRGE